jgi:hypothetical protein
MRVRCKPTAFWPGEVFSWFNGATGSVTEVQTFRKNLVYRVALDDGTWAWFFQQELEWNP